MDDLASQVGTNFWFVFFAYVSAFLPWTALASRDFIGPKWETVKNTRVAGMYNIILSVIPACYIVSYIVIQGLSNDYTEMCAALVALVFSILHVLRTLWGLWQLRCFRRWAQNSIDALEVMGVPYKLTSGNLGPTATTAEVVEHLLVNESIVDNQIIHGQVRCYIRYGQLKLQGGSSSDSPPLNCVKSLFQGVCIMYHFLCDQAGALFGRTTRHRMKQVPFQPVDVWLNWSVPFVAQGLGNWVNEFNMPPDPSHTTMGNREMSAKERLDRRAEYFAFQVLSSAWLQLWPELGLSSSQETPTPLHWDVWDENSKLAKGLISKWELLKKAMSSGEALPFGASHDDCMEESWEREAGYGGYRRMLGQIVNELPVLKEFDAEVEKFDIEKLEWLTILLHLGNLARKMKAEQRARDGESSDKSPTRDPSERGRALNDANCESGTGSTSTAGLKNASSQDVTDVALSQAVDNLRKQLNIVRYTNSSDSGRSSALFHCISISGWCESGDWFKNENRHVMKVGEMIDVWMSLLGGDQIMFMNELNGSDFWDKVCRCGVEESSGEGVTAEYSAETGKAIEVLHAEVEKRRLYYDMANPIPICEHLDPFVTFMGYSMENVRSRLAIWVRDRKGPVPEDSFRPLVEKAGSVTVDLDRELSRLLTAEDIEVALKRRGIQTRLLWELQRGLAREENTREENKGPVCVRNIALCIMSFPSLCVKADGLEKEDVECRQNISSVFMWFSCGFRICAVGAPQRFEVKGKLSRKGETVLATMSVSSAQEEKRFEWELWRDAFSGRLMGLKEWQEGRGIRGVEFQGTIGRMDQGVVEVDTTGGEKIVRWAGWEPFRFGFLRFELDSVGLLQDKTPQTVGQTRYDTEVASSELRSRRGRTETSFKFVRVFRTNINQVRTVPVEYAVASPEALRHAYLVVEEAFRVKDGMKPTSRDDGVSALMTRAHKCLTETNDMARAVFLFETAASIEGNLEAFDRCVEVLISDLTKREAAARVVDVMEHFIAKLISDRRGQRLRLNSAEVKTIRTAYEKLIERFGDVPQIRSRLPTVMRYLLLIDPDEFMDSVISGLQMIYCMSKDETILSMQASLLSANRSDSFHANIQRSLDIACKNTLQGERITELKQDIMRYCIELCRKALSTTKTRLDMKTGLILGRETTQKLAKLPEICLNIQKANADEANALNRYAINNKSYFAAMNILAYLLVNGADGVDVNANEAEALYRRAIEEGNDVAAMNNLAILLVKGADGVEVNAKESESLYRRAIEEGNDVAAMNNLAHLLKNGADCVEVNAKEAKALYRRAIKEGNDVAAMNNLALLLVNGADGVNVNAKEAEALYRRAIEEENDVAAMFNLAYLLEDGADGVEVNAKEAEALYRRAIEEGNHVYAMRNLAILLRNGADGVEVNAEEAEALYRRAIEEGNDVAAMYNLAVLLVHGADGVNVNAKESEELYRCAIDEGNHVFSMINLALLLVNGADGVEVNAKEAEALYRRAIKEGNEVPAMNNLALLLVNGADGVDVNAKEAEALYRRAIKEGNHVAAMSNLAYLLVKGADGVDVNAKEAEALYRRAVEEGNEVYAMNNLAHLLKNGADGVEVNAKEAEALFRRAIKEGNDVTAMYKLAILLVNGADGVDVNAKEAEALFRRAIKEGNDVTAMYNLALLLVIGADGVDVNAKEAEALYRRAIEEGNDIAVMNNLALLLENGADGVNVNAKEAEALYRRASD